MQIRYNFLLNYISQGKYSREMSLFITQRTQIKNRLVIYISNFWDVLGETQNTSHTLCVVKD